MLIYRAINKINNKAYVGLTSKTLHERRVRHYTDARGKVTSKFQRALQKYDKDDWLWEVLAECETFDEANELEIQYIAENNTFKTGYNSTTGGYEAYWPKRRTLADLPGIKVSGITITQENKRSKEYRQNMSESKKAFYESEKGKTLRQSKSEKMKVFWASPEGQECKELLRKKCGRPQSEEKKQTDSERMKKIWNEKGAQAFNR